MVYSARIIELKKIKEHPNADELVIADLEDLYTEVVIRESSFNLGDKVIFFPPDGVLDEQFCKDNNLLREDGGYIHPNRRIKAISLLGVRSNGLIMPIEALSKYCNTDDLKVGDEINILNGVKICEKFVSKATKKAQKNKQSHKKKKRKIKYPFFFQHSDTNQLRYNLNNFKEGDEIILTEKIHSTSGRSSNALKITKRGNKLLDVLGVYLKPKEEYKYIMGSRRVNIPLSDIDKKDGFHGGNVFRLKAHNRLKDKIQKGENWYYEIVGYDDSNRPIMPIVSNKKLKDKEFIKKYGKKTHFKYGLDSGNDIYIYRITMTNPDGFVVEYPWDFVKYRCAETGVKYVPELDRFYFTTIDDLMKRVERFLGKSSVIDPTHIMEGVAVRINNKPTFDVYKDKCFEFKVLEGITKTESDVPDMEEQEEEL